MANSQTLIEMENKYRARTYAPGLACARLEPRAIDHIFFVSTTGLATPSIDARLANSMRMRNDVRRTPISGLGCAGGAAGLSRACEFTRYFPDKHALVLALELCALPFRRTT